MGCTNILLMSSREWFSLGEVRLYNQYVFSSRIQSSICPVISVRRTPNKCLDENNQCSQLGQYVEHLKKYLNICIYKALLYNDVSFSPFILNLAVFKARGKYYVNIAWTCVDCGNQRLIGKRSC